MQKTAAPDVVRIVDATVRIASNTILGPVSLSVRHGESWAIVGPNGSGKSTLLDLAGGIRHPTSGVVELFGGRLGTVDVRERRARIGFVGHHVAEAIPGNLAVRDVALTGKRSTLVPWMQTFDAGDRRRAERSPRTRGVRRSRGTRARDVQPGRTSTGVAGPGAVRTPAAPAARRAGGRVGSPRPRAAAPGVVLHRRCVADDHARHPPCRRDTQDRDSRGAPATRPSRRLWPDPGRADRRRDDRVLRSPGICLVRRRTMARLGALMPDGVRP